MKFFTHIIFSFIITFGSSYSQQDNHICADSKIKYFSNLNKTNGIQYPGDETIDVTYYKLDVTLDYDSRNISGNIAISAKSLQDSLNTIYLDLQNALTINSITHNAENVVFTHSNNIINITLYKS